MGFASPGLKKEFFLKDESEGKKFFISCAQFEMSVFDRKRTFMIKILIWP